MDKILIVEDDRFFRELFSNLLVDSGYHVDTASSGEEALLLINQEPYALVVTDLVMSGISGLELLARIKARDPSIDVIMVTGNANLESAVFSLKHGARDYLVKPVNSDELLHSVRLGMEQRRLLNENVELKNMINLFQTSQALSSCLDLEGVCHLAVDALAREASVTRGIAFIKESGQLRLCELKGIDTSIASLFMDSHCNTIDKNFSGDSAHPLKIIIPGDRSEFIASDLREALIFPMFSRNNLLGGVVLFNDIEQLLPSSINDTNTTFLQEHAARAFDNALRYTATRDMLYIDELSGLFNYRYLKIALEREIKRADRYSTHLSVIFLDLDNFKGVNDTYGHMVGSTLLRELGTLLKRSVRELDVVIRYGGDEYTIILVETPPETAQKIGERIRSMIERNIFLGREGYNIKLTASIGYACYPEDTTNIQELLGMADKAMYAGKAAGKNCIYRLIGTMLNDPSGNRNN